MILEEARAIRLLAPGPDRARLLHQRLDEVIREFEEIRPEAARAVRCQRGCAHCCRIWVGITLDEALLLAERVREGRAEISMMRLDLQRHWSDPQDFARHSWESARCVFLSDDGSCSVYEDRPNPCRALQVASDPEFCRTAEPSGQVLAVINPRAEMLVSAAQTADEGTGNNLLATRLWEALSR